MLFGNNSSENFKSGNDERKKLAERTNIVYHYVLNADNSGVARTVEAEAQAQTDVGVTAIRSEVEPDTHNFDLFAAPASESMEALERNAQALIAEAYGTSSEQDNGGQISAQPTI